MTKKWGIVGLAWVIGVVSTTEIPRVHSAGALIISALLMQWSFSFSAYWGRNRWATLAANVVGTAFGFTLSGAGLYRAEWIMLAIVAMLSLLFSSLAHFKRPHALQVRDGLVALAVLVLSSLVLSATMGFHPELLQAARGNLSVLVTLYLATPPTEILAIILILWNRGMLSQFIEKNYRNRPIFPLMGIGIFWGVVIFFMTGFIVTLERRLAHIPVRSNNPFVFSKNLPHILPDVILMSIAIVILAPIAEEALFRGVLFETMQKAWGLPIGVAVAASLFGAAHLDPSLFLPLALAGVALCLLYFKTRSLITSMSAHATLNAIAIGMALATMK